MEEKLLGFGLGRDILDITPKVQATEGKMNMWDYMKWKNIEQWRE